MSEFQMLSKKKSKTTQGIAVKYSMNKYKPWTFDNWCILDIMNSNALSFYGSKMILDRPS